MSVQQEITLQSDMRRVVETLHGEEASVAPYRREYRQLLDNHGKMIRATLVVLFGRAAGGNAGKLDGQVITGAAAIEMLHLATLVHDDVLDSAPIRRNQPTVHTTAGNKAAIYLGDLILSRYMEIMAQIAPSTDFLREQASTVCEIVGGELLQEAARHNAETTLDYYRKAIGGKTAALFRLACLTGVRLGSQALDPALLETARAFGDHVGMAFQIMDDIADFDLAHDTGKPKLEDVSDGIYTLPVLLALRDDPDVAGLLSRNDPKLVEDYLQLHPELIRRSQDEAMRHLDEADACLAGSADAFQSATIRQIRDVLRRIRGQL
ncbi:polyprenyl synthetase family protein [Bifidobacterium sp.]|jgi:heptaprenyl diphosphate synthase|uniref:polyprenyl synthetase family protein n=1 Tax=Bifidobacterium sp. TaxID=41200 RepID=UPI0025BC6360|nr:polyprenyl synthetase family protein [Bifidobacterium sp.]MCH4208891.1 polyprenyl synthetase family protein [Bifidobacterium sp.]MCI1224438.1 polyprenyl synthetase family protein [Bifidobacterium sp.]